jgi:hypothetical protein
MEEEEEEKGGIIPLSTLSSKSQIWKFGPVK